MKYNAVKASTKKFIFEYILLKVNTLSFSLIKQVHFCIKLNMYTYELSELVHFLLKVNTLSFY